MRFKSRRPGARNRLWRYNLYLENQWHSWFAWYPVRITDGKMSYRVIAWLETIERKKHIVTYPIGDGTLTVKDQGRSYRLKD